MLKNSNFTPRRRRSWYIGAASASPQPHWKSQSTAPLYVRKSRIAPRSMVPASMSGVPSIGLAGVAGDTASPPRKPKHAS